MQKRDEFKDWLKDHLEEEMNAVRFSAEARAKVRLKATVNTAVKVAANPTINQAANALKNVKSTPWWMKRIPLPGMTIAFCIVFLLVAAGLYTRTFLFVSSQEIAEYQACTRIIAPGDNTPFGALQTAVVQLPDRGADRK